MAVSGEFKRGNKKQIMPIKNERSKNKQRILAEDPIHSIVGIMSNKTTE